MENNFSLATTAPAPVAETAPAPVERCDDNNFVVDLTTRTTAYCSLIPATVEEKATLYNATNNPAKRIKDCINETINIANVFVEVVNCTNPETGETTTAPRTVIIDENGVGYTAVSLGIFGALKKLFSIFGEPATWEKPLSVKVRQINRSTNKNILTFDIVTK